VFVEDSEYSWFGGHGLLPNLVDQSWPRRHGQVASEPHTPPDQLLTTLPQWTFDLEMIKNSWHEISTMSVLQNILSRLMRAEQDLVLINLAELPFSDNSDVVSLIVMCTSMSFLLGTR
jgi:hypothetical protein